MTNYVIDDAKHFAKELLDTLRWDLRVFVSYFADGKPVEAETSFDYKIFVAAPSQSSLGVPWERLSDPSELSLLECLLLDESLDHANPFECFVVGARFGPKINQEPSGKILSPWEIISLNEVEFLRQLLNDLELLSPHHSLLPGLLQIETRSSAPAVIKNVIDQFRREEALPDDWLPALSFTLKWLMDFRTGLAKVLAIPVLSTVKERERLPLTKIDASRIDLIEDLYRPRYRPRRWEVDPGRLKAHWVTIAARLFIYGPLLDTVNVYREKQFIKVCPTCGEFFYPYQYGKETHVYCSHRCARGAESKRRYERKKAQERDDPPYN